jgi:hypothetical protein
MGNIWDKTVLAFGEHTLSAASRLTRNVYVQAASASKLRVTLRVLRLGFSSITTMAGEDEGGGGGSGAQPAQPPAAGEIDLPGDLAPAQTLRKALGFKPLLAL